jgi:hypothetical protein
MSDITWPGLAGCFIVAAALAYMLLGMPSCSPPPPAASQCDPQIEKVDREIGAVSGRRLKDPPRRNGVPSSIEWDKNPPQWRRDSPMVNAELRRIEAGLDETQQPVERRRR